VVVGWPLILSKGSSLTLSWALMASRIAASFVIVDNMFYLLGAQYKHLLTTAEHSRYIDVVNQVVNRLWQLSLACL
jgi:hypothetical protein